MKNSKYLINVDFPTKSVIHLNPPVSKNCVKAYGRHLGKGVHGGSKLIKDGGIVYATEEEAKSYLSGSEKLIFNGKEVKNLSPCGNCKKNLKFTIL